MAESTVDIKIKHSGKTYPITVELSEPGLTLKYQIASLTNVPPERQKVVVKGGPLKDDADVSKLGFKAGQTIMVLGTPLENVFTHESTHNDVKFVEDLKSSDIIKLSELDHPSGLVNLGNTCYLNSSLQALFTIDELKDDFTRLNTKDDPLMSNMKELFYKMNERNGKVTPLNFLSSLRRTFPQFAEQDQQHGFYKQQDAEEAFSQILNSIFKKFPDLEKYFKVEFKTETKCIEVDSDEPNYNFEESMKLNCHINGQTNFLQDGLKKSLKESLEKNNEVLNRNAIYEIEKKITKLPKYLTVHFVRFFWKRETGKKAKIMRKVQFPFQLDVFDLLDDSVKEEKAKLRDEIFKIGKANEEESRQFKKQKPNVEMTTREQYAKQREEYQELQKKWKSKFEEVVPNEYKTNGENPSCVYELSGIIAHQGASADSGHYQAFIKDENDNTGEKWFKFNDDKVTVIDREKILALAGGSEGDSALILIYKGVGL